MIETVLILPDTHTPYEDKRKFNLFVKVLSSLKPEKLVVLGDFFDFYQVSAHDKDPERKNIFVDDIEYGRGKLKELRKHCGKAYFIEGNHENRMTRYIWRTAPELHGLDGLSVKSILGMDELDYHFTPYRDWLQIGKMNFTHDVGDAGAFAHYKAQQAFDGNIVIGHTHRLGYTVVGNARGKSHVAAMFGWMGDAEHIDYAHRIKVLRNSVHGFGIGYHDTTTGFWQLVPVPIINNSVTVNGRLIKG